MIRTQVLLTPALKLDLQKAAREEGVSFSEMFRRAVILGLRITQPPKKNATLGLLELAKKAKHSHRRAPADLSQNDDILYRL